MTRRRKTLATIALAAVVSWIVLVAVSVVKHRRPDPESRTPRAADASAGVNDAVCVSCHRTQADYAHTAHAMTSSIADASTIKGNFAPDSNLLRTVNPDLYFAMEAKPAGHFQTGVLRKPEQILTRSERFDIVVGSGRKGQSYLFWDGDGLFQLPVSYWTELGAWVNSPGYVDGTADFDRPILPRCLECHATSFAPHASSANAYNKESLRLGISCQRCHGPGEEHVARFRSSTPPTDRAEWKIVNPAHLPRERQIDACALCHAGIGRSLTPPLTFAAGDVLARHLSFPEIPADAPLDVHASQVQLLQRSRCYQQSSTMTCSTCHDVHTTQRDLPQAATSCLQCHQVEQCGVFARHGRRIETQCVTCHMPAQETAQIISSSHGRQLQPKVRNHRIGIYPEAGLP